MLLTILKNHDKKHGQTVHRVGSATDVSFCLSKHKRREILFFSLYGQLLLFFPFPCRGKGKSSTTNSFKYLSVCFQQIEQFALELLLRVGNLSRKVEELESAAEPEQQEEPGQEMSPTNSPSPDVDQMEEGEE
ncbi:hypothetical protein niasHS_014237 [Heterodera schachtii]|uniref:Uncharacterized protein n=1 Tax=Heterodera schachtii TaxID=97005 RepID=A0ABD2IA06_HETSC